MILVPHEDNHISANTLVMHEAFCKNCAMIIQASWRSYWARLQYQSCLVDPVTIKAVCQHRAALADLQMTRAALVALHHQLKDGVLPNLMGEKLHPLALVQSGEGITFTHLTDETLGMLLESRVPIITITFAMT